MKIRTRLLVFLLPAIIISNLLIASFFSYYWYREIYTNYRTQLSTSISSLASLLQRETNGKPTSELKLQDYLKEIPNTIAFSSLSIQNDLPLLYNLKNVHITSIYKSKQGQKIMSGYAPIFDSSGKTIAVLSAEVSASPIEERLHEKFFLIFLSTSFTIALTTLFLWVFASKISRPIQRLGGSALAIAAGQYGDKIQVKGPKEIIELANTLNTMSECLHENINRLKENSLLRERMYGEYECAMLLQHLMLQKMIDDCHSDAIAVKSITFFSENPRGLLLDLPKKENASPLSIHLIEAKEVGFEGMYELLTQYKLSKGAKLPELDETFPSLHVSIDLSQLKLKFTSNHFTLPIIWSLQHQAILENDSKEISLSSGDFFFLFNEACSKLCGGQKKIHDLISKILKYFAEEGLEICVKMIHKELAFLVKKKDPDEDIHFISFQVLI